MKILLEWSLFVAVVCYSSILVFLPPPFSALCLLHLKLPPPPPQKKKRKEKKKISTHSCTPWLYVDNITCGTGCIWLPLLNQEITTPNVLFITHDDSTGDFHWCKVLQNCHSALQKKFLNYMPLLQWDHTYRLLANMQGSTLKFRSSYSNMYFCGSRSICENCEILHHVKISHCSLFEQPQAFSL